jgi:hypothetical protein
MTHAAVAVDDVVVVVVADADDVMTFITVKWDV